MARPAPRMEGRRGAIEGQWVIIDTWPRTKPRRTRPFGFGFGGTIRREKKRFYASAEQLSSIARKITDRRHARITAGCVALSRGWAMAGTSARYRHRSPRLRPSFGQGASETAGQHSVRSSSFSFCWLLEGGPDRRPHSTRKDSFPLVISNPRAHGANSSRELFPPPRGLSTPPPAHVHIPC